MSAPSFVLKSGLEMSPYTSLRATSLVRQGEPHMRPYRLPNNITRIGRVKPPFSVSSTLVTFPETRVIV
jgi:hypothetical protein